MGKKLTAMAAALACMISVAGSVVSAVAVLETNTSDVSIQTLDIDVDMPIAASEHKKPVKLNHNLTNTQLKYINIKFYDGYHRLRETALGTELADGIELAVSDYDMAVRGGDIWTVEYEAANSGDLAALIADSISAPLVDSAGKITIDVSDTSVSTVTLWDESKGGTPAVIKTSLNITLKSDITGFDTMDTLCVYDSKGDFVKSFHGLRAGSTYALSLNSEDKGTYSVCYVSRGNKSYYAPVVNFDAVTDGAVTMSVLSSKPSGGKDGMITLDLGGSSNLTSEQLCNTFFAIRDHNNNVHMVVSGHDIEAHKNIGANTITIPSSLISSELNGNMWRITGEYHGDDADVFIPEVQFKVVRNNNMPVTVNASIANGVVAPAAVGILVKSDTKLSEARLADLTFTVKDAFGRTKSTFTGTDIIANKAMITIESNEMGIWVITCEDKSTSSSATSGFNNFEMTFDTDTARKAMSLDMPLSANDVDVKVKVPITFNKWSDYIKNAVDLLGIKWGIFDSSGKQITTISNDMWQGSGSFSVTFPAPNKDDKFTIKAVNAPDDMPSIPSATFSLKADMSAPSVVTLSSVKINGFNNEKNFCRTVDVMAYANNKVSAITKEGQPHTDTSVCNSILKGMGTTQISVPVDKNIVIRNQTIGTEREIDSTVSEKIDTVAFATPWSKYSLFLPDREFTESHFGGGERFAEDAFTGSWKTAEPFNQATVDSAGYARVEIECSGVKESFYWMPSDDENSVGILYNSNEIDSIDSMSIGYRFVSQYVTKQGIYSMVHNNPDVNGYLWFVVDANRDGEVNVFDGVKVKRNILNKKK